MTGLGSETEEQMQKHEEWKLNNHGKNSIKIQVQPPRLIFLNQQRILHQTSLASRMSLRAEMTKMANEINQLRAMKQMTPNFDQWLINTT